MDENPRAPARVRWKPLVVLLGLVLLAALAFFSSSDDRKVFQRSIKNIFVWFKHKIRKLTKKDCPCPLAKEPFSEEFVNFEKEQFSDINEISHPQKTCTARKSLKDKISEWRCSGFSIFDGVIIFLIVVAVILIISHYRKKNRHVTIEDECESPVRVPSEESTPSCRNDDNHAAQFQETLNAELNKMCKIMSCLEERIIAIEKKFAAVVKKQDCKYDEMCKCLMGLEKRMKEEVNKKPKKKSCGVGESKVEIPPKKKCRKHRESRSQERCTKSCCKEKKKKKKRSKSLASVEDRCKDLPKNPEDKRKGCSRPSQFRPAQPTHSDRSSSHSRVFRRLHSSSSCAESENKSDSYGSTINAGITEDVTIFSDDCVRLAPTLEEPIGMEEDPRFAPQTSAVQNCFNQISTQMASWFADRESYH